MALNDRYLNPQMGRILRTLGFDRTWRGGEGAHLIDSDGERYLDLFGGYGVFAIGRNHPEAIAAIEEVMAARTGNLPQLGVTLLSGVLAEQLLARAPASVAAMVPANTGTEAVEAAIKIARAATGAPARAVRRARLPRAHARRRCRSTATTSSATASGRCWRTATRSRSATSTRSSASSRAATWPRSCVEPVQGKGVNLPPEGYLRGRPAAVPRGGRAVRLRRGADRHRAHRALSGARALGSRARPDLPRQGALRRARADRRGARLARGLRQRCSTAWSAPCATARRSAATTSPPPPRWPRCGCSTGRAWSSAPSGWGRCCWS